MYKISGVSVETIAKKYQTPIYIYDEAHMIKNINDLKNNFKSKKYQIKILYASKAFTCKSMIKLAKNNGMCLDVVSGGELYLANSVKYDTSKIYFHGNNKLEQEIRDGLKAKIGAFVVDNKQELEKIINISNSIKLKANILIRLNPKVEAHTHEYIQTSKVDSKFGINIDYTDQIADMIKMCEKSKYIKVLGFHAHIGSQIFDMKGYEIEIENMLKFMSKINKLTNNDFGVLNLGSGFGVKYTDVDKPLPLAKVGKWLINTVDETLAKYKNVHLKELMIEPGRCIVAEAGYTLYTVGFTKKTDNKEFLFIDGGMADNIRPALYGSKYYAILANKEKEKLTKKYEVAGKCCESGDVIIHDCKLPNAKTGDLLLVFTTGAYGSTMSSNYNMLNKLPVVFVKNGKDRLVVRRETYKDQCQRDLD